MADEAGYHAWFSLPKGTLGMLLRNPAEQAPPHLVMALGATTIVARRNICPSLHFEKRG